MQPRPRGTQHGESVDPTLARSAKSCTWDLKIVDEDDDDVEWASPDLCKAAHITLMYGVNAA